MRYAILKGDVGIATIRRYLPSNYSASYLIPEDINMDENFILIYGFNVAGWTMEDYVIPRLNSGGYYPKEL